MDPRHADTDSRGEPAPDELLRELKDGARRLAAAEALRLRARLERGAVRLAAGVALAVLGVAALLTAGVQLALGLAGALTAAFDGPVWLGDLLGGLALPALALGALWWADRRRARARIRRARELSAQAGAAPVHRMPTDESGAAA